MYTLEHFLKIEINEAHRNLDRLQHGMDTSQANFIPSSAQTELLANQEARLAFLNELAALKLDCQAALDLAKTRLFQAEAAHQKIAYQENFQNGQAGDKWWKSLHQIEFFSDFIQRIHAWQNHYQAS